MGETKQVALIYYDTQNYENYETTVTVSRETAPTTPDPDTGDDTTGGSPDHSDNVNGDVDNSDENIAGGGSANGEGTDTETPDNETTTPEEGEHPAVSDGCASATVGVVPIIAAVGAWVFLKKRKQ
jgi:hypothetical protein